MRQSGNAELRDNPEINKIPKQKCMHKKNMVYRKDCDEPQRYAVTKKPKI
jgi:hypothetical protein